MDKTNIRKYKDNKNKKMKYWKKTYPFINVKDEQYEEFSNNFIRIKKVIDILDFIKELDIDMEEYNNFISNRDIKVLHDEEEK